MTLRPRNKVLWALPVAVAALLGGCSSHVDDYSAFTTIDPEGWDYGKSYVYLPQIENSVADGVMRLAVRHSNEYPYRNLWLEVTSQVQGADSTVAFRVDTLNVVLADAYGNWLGSGLGTSFQKSDTLAADYRLISGAPVRVRHIMRLERVEGLEQVGIIFEKK